MGGGSPRSEDTAAARQAALRASGYKSGFKHEEDARAGRVEYKVHETLSPKREAGPKSENAGLPVREALDNDDQPESLGIVVGFDQTSSMKRTPGVLQRKLGILHGLTQRKGYVAYPQFSFCAIGDARNMEKAPLQVGQFESDNRGDEALENLLLEGMGGGGNHESYELLAYYLAYHTVLDSWDKRGKRGYAFFLGDERVYSTVRLEDVRTHIGEKAAEQFLARFEGDSVPTKVVFDELQKRFDTYFLFVAQGSYRAEQVVEESAGRAGDMGWGDAAVGWKTLLPADHVVTLEEAEAVSETIGLILGVAEGTVDLDEGADDLRHMGASESAVKSASLAVATLGGSAGGGGGLAKVEGGPDLSGGGADR